MQVEEEAAIIQELDNSIVFEPLLNELRAVPEESLPPLLDLLVGFTRLMKQKQRAYVPEEPAVKRLKVEVVPAPVPPENAELNEQFWKHHQEASTQVIRSEWRRLAPRQKEQALALVQLPRLAVLLEASAPEWDEWLLQALCCRRRPACTLLELLVTQQGKFQRLGNKDWLVHVRSLPTSAGPPGERLALYLDPEGTCPLLPALHRRWGVCRRGHALCYTEPQLSHWMFDFLAQSDEPEVFFGRAAPAVAAPGTLLEGLANCAAKLVPLDRLALFLVQSARGKPAPAAYAAILGKFVPLPGWDWAAVDLPLPTCSCVDCHCGREAGACTCRCSLCREKAGTRQTELPWLPGRHPLCSSCLSHLQRHRIAQLTDFRAYLWDRSAKKPRGQK